jgi:DNA-binding IclR family transcriptional regulator
MDTAKPARPSGTQAIERSIELLKLLATRAQFGWRLTDLARRAGMDKPTVHRILACLQSARLVLRDAKLRRYFPGPMLVELGLSVTSSQPLVDEGRALAERLAHRTDGVAFLYLRSGVDCVVAARCERRTNHGMLNDFGCRRPLITSSGGVAMLSVLPREERESIVENNLGQLRNMGVPRLERFEQMLARSLRTGYAQNLQDVASGIHSFSVAILDRSGSPIASIAVAGDPDQFPEAAGPRLASLLRAEVMSLNERVPRLYMPSSGSRSSHATRMS